MSLLEETKYLLQRYRIFPKKRLGQNFMIDPSFFRSMTSYAILSQNDMVLDIGAGLGFLTNFLARKCKFVLAVESDSRLVEVLRKRLRCSCNVKIIEGDVLKVQLLKFNKVVSIPPYYISSSVVLWLLNKKYECAVLIFQKEFANRLVTPVGSKNYGWLTVITYYYAEIELLDKVPKWAFYPKPDVDSVIVRLKPRGLPPFTVEDIVLFKELVQASFTNRNKKVRNAVIPFIKSKLSASKQNAVRLANSLPFREKRIRELSPEDFGVLSNALAT